MGGVKMTKWSPSESKESEIARLYQAGHTVAKIMEICHCSNATVYKALVHQNITLRGSRIFTDAEEAEIAKIYQAGHSARAIMRAYGMKCPDAIYGALKRHGVEQRTIAERSRIYKLNEYAFDVIDNEQAAYFLGFLFADGHVAKHRALMVGLQERDIDHLYRLRDFLRSDSPVLRRLSSLIKTTGKRYVTAHIVFISLHMGTRLEELGITTNRTNPQAAIDAVPEHLRRHWIRGYMDGDGNLHVHNGQIHLHFDGPEFILSYVREQLAKYASGNPNVKLVKQTRSSSYTLAYGGNNAVSSILAYLYKDATVWLPRKRAIYESAPRPQRRRRGTGRASEIRRQRYGATGMKRPGQKSRVGTQPSDFQMALPLSLAHE